MAGWDLEGSPRVRVCFTSHGPASSLVLREEAQALLNSGVDLAVVKKKKNS